MFDAFLAVRVFFKEGSEGRPHDRYSRHSGVILDVEDLSGEFPEKAADVAENFSLFYDGSSEDEISRIGDLVDFESAVFLFFPVSSDVT